MKTFQQFQEGLLKKALITTALATPFVMKKIKDKFDPVGNQRKKTQDKKATEYEKKTGTSKEDGYFR
tara:strand:+ start:575 stop:775 length:201 start_codon:yes stop_codon:yes gene_type:complete